MAKAIEILMNEHRLIEQVLGALETYAIGVEEGGSAERPTVSDFAAFFRGFADTCHHGKEEDILFRRMVERGFPRESGPLAVMLYEHELGRAHVGALVRVAEATGPVSAVEAHLVLENAFAYIPLLRTHILKEDRILYPMAVRLLTGPELDAMETAFEAFEKQVMGDGTHDRLHRLADALCAAHRPDPARMANAPAGPACGMAP
jgi:hemerythrin-like domain-containing protein